MNFSAPFINRPIAKILLMVGLLLCGLASGSSSFPPRCYGAPIR